MKKRVYIRWFVLASLLVFVWSAMVLVDVSEWYAHYIYPSLSYGLSRFSSLFPFSVGDVFIYGSIVGLVTYLIYTLVERKSFLKSLRRTVEYLAWVYVWFYLAWGLNYFRHSFFSRTQIPYVAYAPEHFQSFLTAYTDSLNATLITAFELDTPQVATEVKKNFRALPASFGLVKPGEHLRVKPMLISSLMSSVGVKGYMGPFFTEFNLNRQLLPVEYPFTYAHEMAHALGIANEAEANLYGYLVCTASEVPEIRFAGYFALFPYVLSNAYQLLSEEEYKQWINSVKPRIKALYNERAAHWNALYSPRYGEMQDVVYNLFLKGNNIPSGTANYSEVIALLIALQAEKAPRSIP